MGLSMLNGWPRAHALLGEHQDVEAGPGDAANCRCEDGERGDSPSPEGQGARGTSIVLTDTQAMEIYWLRALSDDHTTELQEIVGKSAIIAKLYEVSPKTIRDIWNQKTWARATRSLWSVDEALLDAHMKGNPGVTSLAAARMELSLPRRPPGRPFGSKDSRPRKKQRGHSSLDEQEELDEKNAELKWQTYKARIAKRFSMRSGQAASARRTAAPSRPASRSTAHHAPRAIASCIVPARAAIYPDDADKGAANLSSQAHLSSVYAEDPARMASWHQHHDAAHGGGHDWGFVGADAHASEASEGHNAPFSDPAHTPFSDPAWGGDFRRASRIALDARSGLEAGRRTSLHIDDLHHIDDHLPPREDHFAPVQAFAQQQRAQSSMFATAGQARFVMEAAHPHRIVHVNQAFEQLVGFLAPEVLGKSMTLLHGPASDKDAHLLLETAMRAGREHSGAAILYAKSGNPFVGQLFATPLPDSVNMLGAAVHFAGVLKDASALHTANGTPLGALCSELRAAMASTAPNREARVVTEASEPHRIVYVSDAWVEMCGFSRTEILGKTMASLQGPATDRQALSAISNSVRDGREHFTTLVNYNKSGVPFVNQLYVCPLLDTVDSTGVATLCMGVLKDVTAMHVQQSSPLGLIVAAMRSGPARPLSLSEKPLLHGAHPPAGFPPLHAGSAPGFAPLHGGAHGGCAAAFAPALRELPHAATAPTLEAVVITEAKSPFRVLYVNDAWVDMCGFLPEEIVGKTLKVLQGPATDTAALWALGQGVSSGQDHSTTVINYKKSGLPFVNHLQICPVPDVLDVYGRQTLLLGVLTDVTLEHASTHLGALVSEMRAARAATVAPACGGAVGLPPSLHARVVLEGAAPHRILSVSDAWEDATGFSAHDSLGLTLGLLEGPATDPGVVEGVTASAGRGQQHGATLLHYKKSGLAFVSCVHATPFVDAVGNSCLLAVLRDVTRQHADSTMGALILDLRSLSFRPRDRRVRDLPG